MKFISITLFLLALTGCASVLSSQDIPPVVYVLRAPSIPVNPALNALKLPSVLSLQILHVQPHPGYASDRILLSRTDSSLDFYAGSRWAEPLPSIVETFAVESFRGAQSLAVVHDSASPIGGVYTLRLTIRRFDADYQNGAGSVPVVRIMIDALLARRDDRSVVGVFPVQAFVPASSNRMSSIIAAFNSAAWTSVTNLIEPVLDAIKKDAAAL